MTERPEVSVVVPLYEEEPNVLPLVRRVRDTLEAAEGPASWELILVDDGSRDGTARACEAAGREDWRVRLVRLARNYGQTAAMQAGFDHARGEVVVSMDGDLQNPPEEIPRLLSELEEGYDLVVGRREGRWSGQLLTRRLPSVAANALIRWITGVPIRDNGCSLKAYRREVLEGVALYSELHRFIPAVAVGMMGASVSEIPVDHAPRHGGRSKYGVSRVWRVLADLLTVTMIRWFRRRPLIMFGYGSVAALVTAAVFGLASVAMAVADARYEASYVFPSVALLGAALALHLVMLGLLSEHLVHHRMRPRERAVAAAAGSGTDG